MKRSLRVQLTSAMLIIFLLGTVTLTALGYIVSRDQILYQTLEKTKYTVAEQSQQIGGWMSGQIKLLEGMATAILHMDEIDDLGRLFTEEVKNDPAILDMYMGFENDFGIFGTTELTPDWFATQRPWYQAAMAAKGELVITEPYTDSETREMVITITRNIGKVAGLNACLSIDVEISELFGLLTESTGGAEGYAFLIDSDGAVLTHPNPDFAPADDSFTSVSQIESYKNLPSIVKSGETVIRLKDYTGVDSYFIPCVVESTGWTIFHVIPIDVINRPVNNLLLVQSIFCVILIIVAVIIMSRLIKSLIMKPLNGLLDIAGKMAEGDMQIKADIKANNEMALLVGAYSQMADAIRSVITDMRYMAKMQDEGHMEYVMDESKYRGAYREVVEDVNYMASAYRNNFNEILGMLGDFGKGNFNSQIRKYPGPAAEVNEIVEAFRTKLKQVTDEISFIADEASHGRLNVSIDERKYEGDWKQIVITLNNLTDAIAAPLTEASRALTRIAGGELNIKMAGDYKGEFAIMQNSLNTTVESLFEYINEMDGVLTAVAQNDLTGEIAKDFKGDFSGLKNSINSITEKLNNMLMDIKSASDTVAEGASKISESGAELANDAAGQSNAIKELLNAINSINSQNALNAQNAQNADRLAAITMENAGVGNNEMNNMLKSMEGIREASSSIANIIKAIDDIAVQTNMLAINASVEASHAGIHGKGFAVVAMEVRNLAQRSQDAAMDTQSLIETAVARIEEGTKIAEATSDALSKIVANITEIAAIIVNISHSSKEQSDAIAQFMSLLNEMSDIVSKSAYTSQNSAETALDLSGQSENLHSLLEKFKLRHS